VGYVFPCVRFTYVVRFSAESFRVWSVWLGFPLALLGIARCVLYALAFLPLLSLPSFIAATLGTGGWLALSRWGLAPHKKHQVSLAH